MKTSYWLAGAGIVEIALLGAAAFFGEPLFRGFPLAVAFLLAAAIPYLVACIVAEREWQTGTRRRIRRTNVATIIGAAVVMRALFLPLPPIFSDDIHRYAWDGRLQTYGINPYMHAPADPAVGRWYERWGAGINHPEIPTIYPPAAQMVFFLAGLLGSGIVAIKAFFVLCDALTAVLVWRILRGRESPGGAYGRRPMQYLRNANPHRIVWYLWNPLVISEIAGNGHVDALAMLFVVLAVHLYEKRKGMSAWAALAVATMAKVYPVLLAAVFWPLPSRLRRRSGPIVFVAMLALLALPYLPAGWRMLGGLAAYAGRWQFNGSLFPLLAAILPDGFVARLLAPAVAGFAGGEPSLYTADTFAPVSRIVALGLLGGVIAWVRRQREIPSGVWTTERRALVVLLAILALAPAAFPWYAVVLVPWLAIATWREARWGIAAWTLTLPLSYVVLPEFRATGVWRDVPWPIRLVEYGVPVLVAALIFMRERLRRRHR